MEAIIINGNTEEIAALVLAIQERQQDKYDAIELIYQSFQKAIVSNLERIVPATELESQEL